MIGARCDLRYNANRQTARRAGRGQGQGQGRHEDKFTLLYVGVTCDCGNFVDKLLAILVSYDATELCGRADGSSDLWRGFDSRSKHGCLFSFFSVVLSS